MSSECIHLILFPFCTFFYGWFRAVARGVATPLLQHPQEISPAEKSQALPFQREPCETSLTKGGLCRSSSLCVFCRIARREEPGTALLPCEYEDLVCFRDIRPNAPHHYLVVPVEHMGNCKTLKTEHIPVGKAPSVRLTVKVVFSRNNFYMCLASRQFLTLEVLY
uniref:Histidine triad nucleotide binding protein 3 n=1 Tax=Otus sunia TaxID=257818 RepID=A0A8C8BFH4_9STRI